MAGIQDSSWALRAADPLPSCSPVLGFRWPYTCLLDNFPLCHGGSHSTYLKSAHGTCIANQGFSLFPTESVTLAPSVMNPDSRDTGHEQQNSGAGMVGSHSAQTGLGRAGGMCPFTNLQRQPCFSLVFPGSVELRTPPFPSFHLPPMSTPSVRLQDQMDRCHSWSLSCRGTEVGS